MYESVYKQTQKAEIAAYWSIMQKKTVLHDK